MPDGGGGGPREPSWGLAWGLTRLVVLAGPWALKLPSPASWGTFLRGLLANMQEADWWAMTGGDERLCPVAFALPGGWLTVMRRAAPLAGGEEPDYGAFDGLPVDPKPSNFGRLAGRVVMVDYGG
jgi:hypothetical protein